MNRGLATQYAPSFALIRAHFALGVAGLVLFSAALTLSAGGVRGYFFQPVLLGLVHLCVLGFLMPIAIGALHQLVPVVFEVRVRSERLSWAAFALYVLCVPGLIGHMWAMRLTFTLPVVAVGAALSLWLYGVNLGLTILAAKGRSLTGAYVIAALLWLLFAVALGATLAVNLAFPFLPLSHLDLLRAHAHAAGLGFFGLLIMGVAYRLLEMFLLSAGAPERTGWLSLVATNVALATLLPAFAMPSLKALLAVGLGAAAVGVVTFLLQIRAIYVRRMNRRPDVAWRHTFMSFAYLGGAALSGLAIAVGEPGSALSERLTLLYGLLAIPGFMGSIVVGQLYKILPFLVWLHRFSAFVGLKKVPSASELLSETPKRFQYALMHAGLWLLAAGLALDSAALRIAGAALFAASSLLVARNLYVIQARRP